VLAFDVRLFRNLEYLNAPKVSNRRFSNSLEAKPSSLLCRPKPSAFFSPMFEHSTLIWFGGTVESFYSGRPAPPCPVCDRLSLGGYKPWRLTIRPLWNLHLVAEGLPLSLYLFFQYSLRVQYCTMAVAPGVVWKCGVPCWPLIWIIFLLVFLLMSPSCENHAKRETSPAFPHFSYLFPPCGTPHFSIFFNKTGRFQFPFRAISMDI